MELLRLEYLTMRDNVVRIQRWWRNQSSLYRECPICYGRVLQFVYPYRCEHEICEDCYNIWMNINNTCPCCREPVLNNNEELPPPMENNDINDMNIDDNNGELPPPMENNYINDMNIDDNNEELPPPTENNEINEINDINNIGIYNHVDNYNDDTDNFINMNIELIDDLLNFELNNVENVENVEIFFRNLLLIYMRFNNLNNQNINNYNIDIMLNIIIDHFLNENTNILINRFENWINQININRYYIIRIIIDIFNNHLNNNFNNINNHLNNNFNNIGNLDNINYNIIDNLNNNLLINMYNNVINNLNNQMNNNLHIIQNY